MGGNDVRHRNRLATWLGVLATTWLLAFTGPASAGASDFHAEVNGATQAPKGCANGAFLCDEATIAEFGTAQYSIWLTSFERTSDSCGDYTATVTFQLPDASTLTLQETGTACGPGRSFGPGARSYGNPVDVTGTWVTASGTGRFQGLNASGTNTIHAAGAHFRATYISASNA